MGDGCVYSIPKQIQEHGKYVIKKRASLHDISYQQLFFLTTLGLCAWVFIRDTSRGYPQVRLPVHSVVLLTCEARK